MQGLSSLGVRVHSLHCRLACLCIRLIREVPTESGVASSCNVVGRLACTEARTVNSLRGWIDNGALDRDVGGLAFIVSHVRARG